MGGRESRKKKHTLSTSVVFNTTAVKKKLKEKSYIKIFRAVFFGDNFSITPLVNPTLGICTLFRFLAPEVKTRAVENVLSSDCSSILG